jgi:hypothetical protein
MKFDLSNPTTIVNEDLEASLAGRAVIDDDCEEILKAIQTEPKISNIVVVEFMKPSQFATAEDFGSVAFYEKGDSGGVYRVKVNGLTLPEWIGIASTPLARQGICLRFGVGDDDKEQMLFISILAHRCQDLNVSIDFDFSSACYLEELKKGMQTGAVSSEYNALIGIGKTEKEAIAVREAIKCSTA